MTGGRGGIAGRFACDVEISSRCLFDVCPPCLDFRCGGFVPASRHVILLRVLSVFTAVS
jgi:hypothetical protein